MTRVATFTAVVLLAAVGVTGFHSPTSAGDVTGDVTIGIRIGTPPPPPPPVVVVTPPPHVVVIEPGVPIYYHHKRYFAYHHGTWFIAERHEGPWSYVSVERVPAKVLALPRAYDKMPPNAKKIGPDPWAHAKRDDGCPPGLAKQGRC